MNRRYDIDRLRVIAIALLLVYHTAISFQPWGFMFGFITNETPLVSLWVPMSMLNVWRIPILFFISGMGVYFSMQHRSGKQLFADRAKRILLPLLFGIFFIVPFQVCIVQMYYGQDPVYSPGTAHLWFLGNIFVYTAILAPLFFYLKKNQDGKFAKGIKKIGSNPFGLCVLPAAFIAETVLAKPFLYELYTMTWHGFFLGLLAFLFGFCFMLTGSRFWNNLLKYRWLFLTLAVGLYVFRLQEQATGVRLVIESVCWIYAVFAFGYKYLNYPGKALSYWSRAAYPVYILHMLFLNLASVLLFPLQMDVHLKYALVLMLTVAGCWITYEFVIRKIPVAGILFGLPPVSKKQRAPGILTNEPPL